MKKIVEIFLGVMTALGGFVDIGELVFTAQGGARFGYCLLWAVVLGTIGIGVYSEMCGRIAAVAHQPVFVVIRQRLGVKSSFVVWLASTIVNVMTCAAEIGGIALLLKLLTGFGPQWMPFAVAAVMIALIALLPFKWIERFFGLIGLSMIVFLVAAIAIGPDWSKVGKGLVPNIPSDLSGRDLMIYAYMIVGLLGSIMMPYEVYFYSSGGIEEQWKPEDIPINKVISSVGFGLGMLVAMAIMVLGAAIFYPRNIDPDVVGSPALLVGEPYGTIGIVLALIGGITTVAGAAAETALAGAYNFAQYFNKPWGRSLPMKQTPAFDGAWIAMLVIAAAIMVTGIDPIVIVELAIIAAVICLPFTYLPILLTARDKAIMGEHVNGPIANGLGWAFFILITVVAIAAPILLVATGMGSY
ncbi:MAG TPA: divalent metal cation transporter [Kofleriaceae bacterium]|nr:divalent metal cation transporter [Kofleriaceae bacterium]